MVYGYSVMLNTDYKVSPITGSFDELDLISIIIHRIIGGDPCSVNWEWFKGVIIYHEIIPFAYLSLKDSNLSVPEDLMQLLRNNYYYALRRCQECRQEFLRILKEFENCRISILPIKGMQFLYDIYARLPARPMVDIDLLVKEDDILKAEELFSNLGYKKELYGLKEEYWRKDYCHLIFLRKEGRKTFIAELHWGLDFKRKNRMVLDELWKRTREIDADGKRIKLLSAEDAFFSLALHNRRFGKPLNIKYAVDLILLLNKHSCQFDWDYILSQCRKYNLSAPVFFSLYQAEFLRSLNIPEYVRKELKIPRWKKRLIQRFIEKNTFPLKTKTLPQIKSLYLKSHFLLYDSLREPVSYVLNIPKEQFAKYYRLRPYTKKTAFLYRNRLFYMLFKSVSLFKK